MTRVTTASAVTVLDRISNPRPRLRAVDYLRVSTEEQMNGYGIDDQGKRTKRHIERKDWDHVGTYKDEGISGSLQAKDRPDLKRLVEDAAKTPRPFDVVVVPEGRAIGRTDRAYYLWVWALEDMGIFVADARTGADNTTDEGRERMREEADYAFKEYTRIRQRTQGGLQEKAEDGGWTGGPPPFGYEIIDQGRKGKSRLGLCLAECKVLRRARELLVAFALTMRQTAAQLNAEGLFTRSGKPWSHQNLRARLLRAMDNVYVFRNTAVKNGKGPKLDQDGNPLYGKTVRIELPPIFTPEEVADLRAVLNTPTSGVAKQAAAAYPLSKRVTALCGKHYIGGKRNSNQVRHYRCKGKTEEFVGAGRCDDQQIPAAEFEAAVWAEVVGLLGDPDQLRMMAEEWIGLADSTQEDQAARIADLDNQLKEN